MRLPLVSIITPTHNHEKYLAFCLQSVINQTFKDWEMIIVDDASSDRTYDIALNFAKKDKRIKILRHKTNWGIKKIVNTYNQALNLSRGKYIAILEGDDFLPKDKLKLQVKAMENDNSVLSYGNWVLVSQSGRKIYQRNFDKFNQSYLNNNPPPSILNLYLTLQFDIGSQTVMIKKDSLLKIGGFHKGKYYPFVDIPTYLRLAKLGRFTYINKVLGYYRRTLNSSWVRLAKKTEGFGRVVIKDEINNFVKNKVKDFSQKINWKEIYEKQERYLQFKKLISPVSFVFNYIASKV